MNIWNVNVQLLVDVLAYLIHDVVNAVIMHEMWLFFFNIDVQSTDYSKTFCIFELFAIQLAGLNEK